jgi:HSP90 family molecular chaperone
MNFELIERAIRLAHKPEDTLIADLIDYRDYAKDASNMIKELYQQMLLDEKKHAEEVAKWINNCNTLMEKLNDK